MLYCAADLAENANKKQKTTKTKITARSSESQIDEEYCFLGSLNWIRDLLYLIESGRLFQILQPRTLFLNFFSMCLGNIQYPLPKLCSVHNVNLNRLAKQSEARSFKVLYMKINTKVDRKPVRFFQQLSEVRLNVVVKVKSQR